MGAKDAGGDTCYYTKMQKAKGVHGLTDAQVKTKVGEKMTKKMDCEAKTDMAQCTAPCKKTKRTSISCAANGDATGTDQPERCEYDPDDSADKATSIAMWKSYNPNAGQKDLEAVYDVTTACKALTDRTACEAAEYTAAETAQVRTAEEASTGMASDASSIKITRGVLMLVGVCAAYGWDM